MKYYPPGVKNRSKVYVPQAHTARSKLLFPNLSNKLPIERDLGAWGSTINKDKLRELKDKPTKLLNIQKVDSTTSLEHEDSTVTQTRVYSGSNFDDDLNHEVDYDEIGKSHYIPGEDELIMQDVDAFANASR